MMGIGDLQDEGKERLIAYIARKTIYLESTSSKS